MATVRGILRWVLGWRASVEFIAPTETTPLTLNSRSAALTLSARSVGLTLNTRAATLTLESEDE